MKKCNKCKQEKEFKEFFRRKQSKDGYDYTCKECTKEMTKKRYNSEKRRQYYNENRERELLNDKIWRENNKEKVKLSNHLWYVKTKQENVAKYLYKYAKSRAAKKGLDFNLEITDIVIPEYCPYLGCKLDNSYKGNHRYSASIDRIDPKKGYVKGNIQVVSRLFNCMKWDSTEEELIKFCTSVLKHKGIKI